MHKKLSEMTLEELWHLFPIFLTEHQEEWEQWYQEEENFLRVILKENKARLNHVGSTAIKDIWAKPIIDILLEIPRDKDMNMIKEQLESAGYTLMSTGENRISLNKGYMPEGFASKVYHLHIRYWGDNDELYFRDYLNENPDSAKAYQELKLNLWKKYEHDRDGYTNAKTAFVDEITKKAKLKYL